MGFKIRVLDGDEYWLSHVDHNGPSVSKYGVHLENLERLVAMMGNWTDKDALVILDEIGKMELKLDAFRDAVTEVVVTCSRVLATVPSRGPRFVETLKERSGAEVIEVTMENRDDLPNRLVDRFRLRKGPCE